MMGRGERETAHPLEAFAEQVALVVKAIKGEPLKERQILSVYIVNFFDAVKETLKRQGQIMSFYIFLSDPVDFGVPPVTAEVAARAKEMKAAAVVSVEGFQSENDITDLVYHVSMSTPVLGVVGWVLKVKLSDGLVEFVREMPYFFDSPESMKTLGELISEMERG